MEVVILNIEVIVCLVFVIIFTVILCVFSILGKNATILISGFNLKSKEEREKYDIEEMIKDYKKSMLIWIVIFFIGAIGSYYISKYFSIISFVIWLIIFFKDVHLDEEKAFGKYKIK